MERKLYRELWRMRFEKMLRIEKKSIVDYEALLTECRSRFRGHSIEPHFEKLIADEKKHVLLCRELIRILNLQK